MSKFKVNDFVVIKGLSKSNPNHQARIVKVEHLKGKPPYHIRYRVSNMNQPFCGTLCNILMWEFDLEEF